jgi:hypothetical protein
MLIGYNGGIALSNLFGIMITHRKDTQDTYQPTSLMGDGGYFSWSFWYSLKPNEDRN